MKKRFRVCEDGYIDDKKKKDGAMSSHLPSISTALLQQS